MAYVNPYWVEYQKQRFTRHDAHRFLRPDADRFVRPEYKTEAQDNGGAAFEIDEIAFQQELTSLRLDWELLKLAVRARKALHHSNLQPRVPAGNSDGGQWTSEGAAGGLTRLAGPRPDNGRPQIPRTRPSDREQRRIALARARKWQGALELLYRGARWLRDYHAELQSYRDPPKTLEELQQDFGKPSVPGYHDHHINEKDAARKDGFSEDLINNQENIVRVPKRKHEEITGWYMKESDRFRDNNGQALSPREYLRSQGWEERRRIGLEALIEFEVLKR